MSNQHGWGDDRNPNIIAITKYVGFRPLTQPTELKDIPADVGKIEPWFGEVGNGT